MPQHKMPGETPSVRIVRHEQYGHLVVSSSEKRVKLLGELVRIQPTLEGKPLEKGQRLIRSPAGDIHVFSPLKLAPAALRKLQSELAEKLKG